MNARSMRTFSIEYLTDPHRKGIVPANNAGAPTKENAGEPTDEFIRTTHSAGTKPLVRCLRKRNPPRGLPIHLRGMSTRLRCGQECLIHRPRHSRLRRALRQLLAR